MILGTYATVVRQQVSTFIHSHVAALDATFGLESLVRYKSWYAAVHALMDVVVLSAVAEGRVSSIGIQVVARNVGLPSATFATIYVDSSSPSR
jgi:hypothetical protein